MQEDVSAKAPSIAVQVVCFRDAVHQLDRLVDAIGACVARACEAGAVDHGIILIGDSSEQAILSDAEVALLRVRALGHPGVTDLRYLFFDANLGSGGGSNRLAAEADTDLLLVLNPDTYPNPDLLTKLTAALSDKTVGIAEARQVPIEHPKFADSSGDTSWASGCCMLVRRNVFDEVNGFDAKHFPMYCDDVDFSWRVRLAGYRVVHVPEAVVAHTKSLKLGGSVAPAPTEVYLSELARVLLQHKWGRIDLRDESAKALQVSRDPDRLRAWNEFNRRLAANRLPPQVDGAEDVAQFINNEFAVHRW